jgi:hypothetical protein
MIGCVASFGFGLVVDEVITKFATWRSKYNKVYDESEFAGTPSIKQRSCLLYSN